MYCNNCGKNVENGSVFCTGCGRRLNEIPAVPQTETNIPTQIPETQAPFTAPVTEPTNSGIYEKTQPLTPEATEPLKEKTYFGKGALAFCLVVIGLLAISTGVFAGLYFSLL